MNSIKIVFQNPWFLFALIPALAVILIPFFCLPKRRRKTVKRIVPVVLHTVVAVLLTLIISGFCLVRTAKQQAVMLVVDLSDSTKTVQSSIQSHTQQLLDLIDEKNPVGVVVFGNNQIYALELGDDRDLVLNKVDAQATNLETAMEYAADQLPTEMAGRMILLSDGKQTDGDADRMARYLATKGIRMDAVYFDTTQPQTPEVQISNVSAPEDVYAGQPVVFTVELESNTDANVSVFLYDGNLSAGRADGMIKAGSAVFELEITPETAGTHDYEVLLKADQDTLEQNNTTHVGVKVIGQSSVLVIADSTKNAETLKEALPGCSVTTIVPRQAPKTIIELCNYEQVILSNVNYRQMPEGFDDLLAEYVEKYGRSVLVAGGEDTMMFGGMEKTKLEQMLPVELTLKENDEAKSVAIMLVIDCSGSMTQRGSPNLSLAKQGAIQCIESMTSNDQIGLVAFNVTAYLQSPLVQGTEENKATLNRIVSGFSTYRGTYYTDAVIMAHNELNKSDADIRHIMFLSDGEPQDRGYMEAVEAAAADGITVSTIGLGYSGYLLSQMAERGGGRYYYVSQATSLPEIMLSETKQVAVNSKIEGQFQPVVAVDSNITADLEDGVLPELTGYLGTTLKENAVAYLTIGDKHPLYASWDYGQGRVSCFMSDLNKKWSESWFSDAAGLAVIQGMVDNTLGDAHSTSSLQAEVSLRGQTATVTVTTAEPTQDTLSLRVAGEEKDYPLTQTEPGKYTLDLRLIKSGVYELMITQTDSGDVMVDHLETLVSVPYPAEYNVFADAGETLLQTICSYSGGLLFTDMQALALLEIPNVGEVLDPLIPFAIICCLLMVVDIAIRKLRWKDIRNYLLRWKK